MNTFLNHALGAIEALPALQELIEDRLEFDGLISRELPARNFVLDNKRGTVTFEQNMPNGLACRAVIDANGDWEVIDDTETTCGQSAPKRRK